MNNSELIDFKVQADKNNYTMGRNGNIIKAITIHHMAGVLTAQQCGKIFQNPNRKASSHYGIGKDGKIGIYVNEENIAWTNSNWKSNCESVTIEVSNSANTEDYPISDIVLDKLIKLIADIAKRNNLGKLIKGENVNWHSMFTATICPGKYLLSKMDYIISEANRINNNYNNNQDNKKNINDLVKEVIQGKWGNGEERKVKLTNEGYSYTEIQKLVNTKLLGIQSVNKSNENEKIVKEVIQGKWGNGDERKVKLTQAGYNYNEIQKMVNKLLL